MGFDIKEDEDERLPDFETVTAETVFFKSAGVEPAEVVKEEKKDQLYTEDDSDNPSSDDDDFKPIYRQQ